MVIVALDSSCGLLKADVVEACEGGTADVFDGVVWNQKLLLAVQDKTSGGQSSAETQGET